MRTLAASVLLLGACVGRPLDQPPSLVPIELGTFPDAVPVDASLPADLAIGDLDGAAVAAPRALAPLSTATASTRQPMFRWALADGTDGAEVTVCRDRGCTRGVTSFRVTGTSGAPPTELDPGLYFWFVRGLAGDLAGAETSPPWELVVPKRSASNDTSSGTFVDADGDGFADVLVGEHVTPTSRGAAYLFRGASSGLATTPVALALPSHDYGATVASAGDVNGDGYADVVVGGVKPGFATGESLLFLGGPSGLSAMPTPLVIPGAGANSAGCTVGSAGDTNGDGYADVIVASCATFGGPGAAHVFLGGPGGLATPAITLDAARGNAVAALGDINGDGYADVAVGAPHTSSGGTVSIFLGGPDGPAPPAAWAFDGQSVGLVGAFGDFGQSLAAGDLDGDGLSDLAIGAPGAVYVFKGSPSGFSMAATWVLAPTGVDGYFGTALSYAGDLDGDGFGDLVSGSSSDSYFRGATYVYRGGPGGPTSPLVLTAPAMAGFFGAATGGAGDVDGDGLADLVVGATSTNNYAGSAFVFFGATTGVSLSPIALLGPDGPTSYFGVSVARRTPARRRPWRQLSRQ